MRVGKKIVPSAVVIIFILTLGVLAGSYLYTNFLEEQYDVEVRNVLSQETEHIANGIYEEVAATFEDLDYLAEYIVSDGRFDCAESIEKIKLIKTGNRYLCMGIADSNGNTYMMDGATKNVSEEEFFQCSMQGEKYITDTVADDSNNTMNIYSVGILEDEKCVGVLFVTNYSKMIDKKMSTECSKMSGNSWVVKPDNGIVMFNSEFGEQKNTEINLFEMLSSDAENEKVVKRLFSNIRAKHNDYIHINYENDDKILYSKELGLNDWYLITMYSVKGLSEKRDTTLFQTNMLIAGFLVLYLVTILFIMLLQGKNKKDIERLAYVDELTGGSSFAKFKKDADKLIKNNDVNTYVLVDIDVDKFKYINDIWGYEEGNNVIRFIWKEIKGIIEDGEIFAHYRADQFVLLLKANDMNHVIERVEELSSMASNRETKNEKNYEIVLSVGIYIIDEKNYRIDTAIDRAELTKKSVKGKHSQLYAIYDEKIRQKVLRDQEIENMMEKALKNEEFKVYYQPKFDSATCELVGAEALVRWYNEEIGMIFPNEFISVFESNGFIAELDKYMFEHVCSDIRRWLDDGFSVVPISVNLSQLQLYNMHFIDEYKMILEKYEIPSEYVQLELTETTLFSKSGSLNKIIDELHEIGFKILMDDFGTGYSSLNMLKNVPVDILKLDKSFVDDIGEPKGNIVVSTIVSLGQLLNMKIVAEGVETKEQFEFLRDIFCDEIQGYYFSRPIPESEYRNEMMKGAL